MSQTPSPAEEGGAFDVGQFLAVFYEESDEHLASMESLLLEVDLANVDPEMVNAIFRAAHSIKGSAGMFGLTDVVDLTHEAETLLDRVRKNQLALSPGMKLSGMAQVRWPITPPPRRRSPHRPRR